MRDMVRGDAKDDPEFEKKLLELSYEAYLKREKFYNEIFSLDEQKKHIDEAMAQVRENRLMLEQRRKQLDTAQLFDSMFRGNISKCFLNSEVI